jgi:hypothetical protein
MDASHSFPMLPAFLIGLTGLSVLILAGLMWLDAIGERRTRQAALGRLKSDASASARLSGPARVEGAFADLDIPKAA